jgi:glycogen synthase
MDRKYQNRTAVRERFWLGETRGPVVAYVGPLDDQEGMHLVHHAQISRRSTARSMAAVRDGTPSFW